jgi:hypothetical protein
MPLLEERHDVYCESIDSPGTQPDPRFSRYGPGTEANSTCIGHGAKEQMLVCCSHGYAGAQRAQCALYVVDDQGSQTDDEADA